MQSFLNLFARVRKSSPLLTQAWRWVFYWYLSFQLKDQPVVFINYGYQAPDLIHRLVLKPDDEPNRTSIQLYDYLLGPVSLQDKTVLEVSSGRGGGADYLTRYHHPKRYIALERSPTAVAFCQRHYHTPNLTFVEGQAENLRFASNSFDAVVNLEASHCYAPMTRFVAEVTRVLRPGGHLLFADFRPPAAWPTTDAALRHTGLAALRQEVINEAVVRASDLDSARRQKQAEAFFPRTLLPYVYHFAAVKGSDMYNNFASGALEYRAYILQKGA